MATRKTPATPSKSATPAKRTRAAASGTRKTAAKTGAKPSAKSVATKPATKAPARRAAAKPAVAQPAARGIGPVSVGALLAAAGAAAYGLYRFVTRRPAEGTVPTDLLGDSHPDGSERAPDAFRPDPTAAVPAAEREQFRPALAQLGNSVS
ncbi:hypothetical protein [Sphingomonas sp. KR3-1]|uniref:hypothetical protein n=1 Tax=Sphingomonas sp. KR3-1 TaxID=3156611 RepID=UPI0032B35B8A